MTGSCRFHVFGVAALLWLLLVGTRVASAAPLFPDVPDHWARDAVAALAGKGLLEGYPDGSFKGDRAMTRYEMAVVVARFLARAEAEHAILANKQDLEALNRLASHLREQLEALGIRVVNLEDRTSRLERRVADLERITFEGDVMTRYASVGMRNTGIGGTNWGTDVGTVNGVNFSRNNKFGTIDLLNGRPLVNGLGLTNRTRLGVKLKVSEDVLAAMRLAGYTSAGNPYIDSYWGVPAPYLSNPFAASGMTDPSGLTHTPWMRLNFDKFMLEHVPSGTRVTVGAIEETLMDNFVLQRIPNPNVFGKSMAKFSERIVDEKERYQVATLRYYEDEETYLPFFGVQASGKARLLTDMRWEVMYSQLPFGSNPTAGPGQAPVNNVTLPDLYSANLTWLLGANGEVKLNYASVRDSAGQAATTPNLGNYWFWTDPASMAGSATQAMPMRGNTFISRQTQWSYGASAAYQFEPTNIRAVVGYAGSKYKPNVDSAYNANGSHFRAGLGWTDTGNNISVDAEYLITNPYYDAFQLYFNPLGSMALGGVPPGTPLAFAVVPLYYGGFPGSYVPFGYQLHDSGLYPNNRNGPRFAAEYRFDRGNGRVNFRGAWLEQNQATIPQRDITGAIHGMAPGFIDAVFHPLNTNGNVVFETPKGRQDYLGGAVSYRFSPGLEVSAQYDSFKFKRSTAFAPDTVTARKNYVNLGYDVVQLGLEYPLNKRMKLRGGYNVVSVSGYHPALNAGTYNPYTNTFVGASAGTTLVNLTQGVPYLGFELDIARNVKWSMEGRYIDTWDHLNQGGSPESFSGPQVLSELNVKF